MTRIYLHLDKLLSQVGETSDETNFGAILVTRVDTEGNKVGSCKTQSPTYLDQNTKDNPSHIPTRFGAKRLGPS